MLTGRQFKLFYDRYQPQPGTEGIDAPPAIRGDAEADARIAELARARGYVLRATHQGDLVDAAGVPLDPTAAQALQALIDDAAAAGYDLRVAYGYRSVDYQRNIILSRISGLSDAEIASGAADAQIDAVIDGVAPPGFSKHHTGFAVDLRSGGGGAADFRNSPVERWLRADNFAVAKRHGFIPSYPEGAGPQGPHPEPWEYVYVGTRPIGCATWLADRNDRRTFDFCLTSTAIALTYLSYGGPDSLLGRLVIGERPLADGRYAQFQDGTIYWSEPTGAHEVHQPLLNEYRRAGGPQQIGFPLHRVRTSRDGRWNYQGFEGARLWDRVDGPGVFTEPERILAEHEAEQGIYGPLGGPVGDARRSHDGRSTYQDFERGRIYDRADTLVEIHGAVFLRHEATEGVYGPLGYPTADLARVPASRGKVQTFEGGRIWYTASTGAHAVWGSILDRYLAEGGPTGTLGYPTSERQPAEPAGSSVQRFEHGTIERSPAGVVTVAPGP
ncbi:MAG: D-alanyl-D-alanine carboxypeptidase family protein [Acidimicrobiales bacterium]